MCTAKLCTANFRYKMFCCYCTSNTSIPYDWKKSMLKSWYYFERTCLDLQISFWWFHVLNMLERKLTFAHHPKFGYLTFCPTNLWTTLRVSVHIKIPNLSKHKNVKTICEGLNLQPRGGCKFYPHLKSPPTFIMSGIPFWDIEKQHRLRSDSSKCSLIKVINVFLKYFSSEI